MTQDLPLILMNMSGMNGNLVAQSGSSGEKMKLLIYGLETVPVELLGSSSAEGAGTKCFFNSTVPLSRVDESDQEQCEQLPRHTGIARLVASSVEFVVERSPTPESLSMARPQNPSQYSDRFIAITGSLHFGLGSLEGRFLTWCFGADLVEKDWRISQFHLIYSLLER